MKLISRENTAEEEVKNPEPVNSMPNSNGPDAQSTTVQKDNATIRNAPKSKEMNRNGGRSHAQNAVSVALP